MSAAASKPSGPLARGPSVVTGLLLALGCLPLALQYLAQLWEHPWYRWYPLALVGALVLAARAILEPRRAASPGRPHFWLPLIGLALGLLVWAGWRGSPWLGWGAMLLAGAGMLGWAGGGESLRRLLPAGVLLLVVWCPPGNQDAWLVEGAEKALLVPTGHLLHTLGVPHWITPDGVTLAAVTVPRGELFLGLHGLPGVLVAGLLWLLLRRRHPARIVATLALLASCFLPAETIRITWGLVASDASGTDFFSTPRATWVVVGMWAVLLGLLFSLDQFMRFLTAPRRRPDLPPVTPGTSAWPGMPAVLGLRGAGSPLAWGVAVLAVAAGGAGLWQVWAHEPPLAAKAPKSLPGAFSLRDWPEWRALSASNSLARLESAGAVRGAWHRQRADLAMAISVAGPAAEGVSPLPLYQAQGWHLAGLARAGGAGTPPCATAELLRDELFRGVLWMGVVDDQGRWLEPPLRGRGREGAGRSYVIQVLAVATRNLTPAERQEVRARFEAARLELAAQIAASPEAAR